MQPSSLEVKVLTIGRLLGWLEPGGDGAAGVEASSSGSGDGDGGGSRSSGEAGNGSSKAGYSSSGGAHGSAARPLLPSKLAALITASPAILGASPATVASKWQRLQDLAAAAAPAWGWSAQLAALPPPTAGRLLASGHGRIDRMEYLVAVALGEEEGLQGTAPGAGAGGGAGAAAGAAAEPVGSQEAAPARKGRPLKSRVQLVTLMQLTEQAWQQRHPEYADWLLSRNTSHSPPSRAASRV